MGRTISAMIVDDHLVVREGLKQLLELEEDIRVVAEAGDGLTCLRLLEEYTPDILFMDISMPGISGIETARIVCEKYPHIKVIMLTIYQDERYIAEAVKAGARGYVLKNINRDELIRIVRHVMEDRAFIDPSVAARLFDHVKRGRDFEGDAEKPSLTYRELEVLNGLVSGLSDRDLSETLHISEHTVRSHIKNLYRKLGVSSRAQAVAKALKDRIIDVEAH